MKQLLGFAVLTGPLFLIVPWVAGCLIVSIWVGQKNAKKSRLRGFIIGITILVISLPLPFVDEIAGSIYFNHLCETEAGVKVYQTIELPAEYWDEDGKPNFYDGNTLPDKEFIDAGVKARAVEELKVFGIQKFGTVFSDKNNDYEISEVLGFRYWGGWLVRNFSPHNTAISCGGGKAYDELVEKQFKPVGAEKNKEK